MLLKQYTTIYLINPQLIYLKFFLILHNIKNIIRNSLSWVWLYMPITQLLGKQKQDDHQFEAIWGKVVECLLNKY
jgi:hypothetical protein